MGHDQRISAGYHWDTNKMRIDIPLYIKPSELSNNFNYHLLLQPNSNCCSEVRLFEMYLLIAVKAHLLIGFRQDKLFKTLRFHI